MYRWILKRVLPIAILKTKHYSQSVCLGFHTHITTMLASWYIPVPCSVTLLSYAIRTCNLPHFWFYSSHVRLVIRAIISHKMCVDYVLHWFVLPFFRLRSCDKRIYHLLPFQKNVYQARPRAYLISTFLNSVNKSSYELTSYVRFYIEVAQEASTYGLWCLQYRALV